MRMTPNGGQFARPGLRPARRTGLAWFACTLAAMGIAPARAATETVIHTFGNFPHGANPYGPLTRDADGNFYGTTYEGGRANAGVVFKLDASGHQTVLYSFGGGADGAHPYAGVIRSSTGYIYGTTYQGGTANAGVVYRVDPAGREKVLYTFSGGADGGNPYAGVVADSTDNLYGTTYQGGTANVGVVYKLDPSGQETVLHSFTGNADGANPYAGVIADASGNLYGTTHAGGRFQAGVVYRLDTSGRETVLHAFSPPHGGAPTAGVVRDSAGNFYGTASNVVYKLDATGHYTVLRSFACRTGGEVSAGLVLDAAGKLYGTTDMALACDVSPAPFGAVYKLDTVGNLTVLYHFPGASRPEDIVSGPNAGLVRDSAGNLYGTTPYGGVSGMVYRVDTARQQTMLYSFSGAPGGTHPQPGVIRDSAGNLYGSTGSGGPANEGVVYKVDTTGRETVLYSFTGGPDGKTPTAGVVLDPEGNLYGATFAGGAANAGVVYKVDTSGHETVLYTFTGGADGGNPEAGVIRDSEGNLYGTTAFGGAASKTGLQEGVVYKVDAAGRETVLYSFTGLADGGVPTAGVIRDAAGNLYGTTDEGGLGAGVVYELDPSGQETVLYSFTGGADGGNPGAGVIRDAAGNLYGTAANYGSGGGGVVFELDTAGHYTVLHSFTYGPDGGAPSKGIVRDPAGNLYGTTGYGGAAGCNLGCGVVYKVDPSGQETVLHTFTGGAGGAGPAGVIADEAGNLCGIAGGGVASGGVLYKLTAR